jgi:hypothetical protein
MDPASAIVMRQINGLHHLCIIPIVEKGKNTPRPSSTQAGQFLLLFQAGKQRNGYAASPPLIVGESRYSAAKPKARLPLDPDPTPNTKKT